jgi:hypothetical protein
MLPSRWECKGRISDLAASLLLEPGLSLEQVDNPGVVPGRLEKWGVHQFPQREVVQLEGFLHALHEGVLLPQREMDVPLDEHRELAPLSLLLQEPDYPKGVPGSEWTRTKVRIRWDVRRKSYGSIGSRCSWERPSDIVRLEQDCQTVLL